MPVITPSRPDHQIGVLLVIAAAVAYSTAGLFTKGVSAGAWEVIFWRGFFAIEFTMLWTLWQGSFRHNFTRFGRSGWAVAIIGALGTAAFISAFKLTSIANVSLIYAAAPLIAALLARVLIGEAITPRMMIGCTAAMLGVGIIMSGSFQQLSLRGDLLALCMTIAMATIMVIYRKYPDTPGAGPTAMQSVLLLPVAVLLGRPFAIPVTEIMILAFFGLLFAIASVTLAEGAKRIPSGQTALISALETPLAPVFAFLILAEVPRLATVIGGTIVFAAVLGAIRQQR